MKVRTHSFNGKKYYITIEPRYGFASASEKQDLELIVNTQGLSERQIMYFIIHEAMHAEDWYMSEAKVERMSKSLRDFLWRLGYRRQIKC